MVTSPSLSDSRRLELKLATAEQAVADLTARERSLAEKLRAIEGKTQTPWVQQEGDLVRRAALLEQRHAELAQRQQELDVREKELAAARSEIAASRESIARARLELDEGFARLSAAADDLVRTRRELKAATAAREKQPAESFEPAAALLHPSPGPWPFL